MAHTNTNPPTERKPRKRNELATLVCLLLLLMITSTGIGYAMYMLRDMATVKLLAVAMASGLILYFMSIFKVGPFRNRK